MVVAQHQATFCPFIKHFFYVFDQNIHLPIHNYYFLKTLKNVTFYSVVFIGYQQQGQHAISMCIFLDYVKQQTKK